MKKRIVLLLVILILSPIAVRPGGVRSGSPVAIAYSTALAQGEAPASGPDSGMMQADPNVIESAKARSRFHYLMLGYGVIWVCLGVFLISLSRRIGRVGSEISELKLRLEATERGRRS